MPPFQNGHKKVGGRKKGVPNKSTMSVKAALEEAFDLVGGVTALVDFAEKYPKDFYALWGRLIPSEIKAVVTGPPTKPRVTRIVVEHHLIQDQNPPALESSSGEDRGRGITISIPSGAGESVGF